MYEEFWADFGLINADHGVGSSSRGSGKYQTYVRDWFYQGMSFFSQGK
jgi:hypothetical protein